MSWSYCTPDGHAVMHAMQPRHRSKCAAAASVSGAPSSSWLTRWIRPRGESISSPHSWYVGQAGKQNPQCTQSFTAERTPSSAPFAGDSPAAPPRRSHQITWEPAGRHPVAGVELVLDRPHQAQRRDAPGHPAAVGEGGAHLGGRRQHGDTAARVIERAAQRPGNPAQAAGSPGGQLI